MNRHEDIALRSIGEARAFSQRDLAIIGAGDDDLESVLPQQSAEALFDIESDVFLSDAQRCLRSRIFAPMAGIENHAADGERKCGRFDGLEGVGE